jgi:protein-tyrosine phosphatase
MNQIHDQLWISDAQSVRKLESDHRFDEVVSLGFMDFLGRDCPEASTTGDEFVFPDGPHEFAVFKSAVDYTVESLNQGDTVLVHCQAGVSRSAGVCATVLAVWKTITLREALNTIEEVRPKINPQPAIRKSMQQYIDSEVVRKASE